MKHTHKHTHWQQNGTNENVQVQRSNGNSRKKCRQKENSQLYFMAHLGVQGKGEA